MQQQEQKLQWVAVFDYLFYFSLSSLPLPLLPFSALPPSQRKFPFNMYDNSPTVRAQFQLMHEASEPNRDSDLHCTVTGACLIVYLFIYSFYSGGGERGGGGRGQLTVLNDGPVFCPIFYSTVFLLS